VHEVEQLFAAMPTVEPYPDGVVRVPARIPGVAFFPGGSGLWGARANAPLPPMPIGDVMVLGHDFHSESGFRQSLAQGTEVPDVPRNQYRIPPTWTNLRRLFEEAGLAMDRCFFTNAYMGLRRGEVTTGRFPGSLDKGFVDRCRRFLLRQLEAQQPSVILTLGTWVPSFLSALSPELAKWERVGSIRDLDAAGPLVHGAVFGTREPLRCTVAALTHPSLRGSNVGRRSYAGVRGHDAEMAMLREALDSSGVREG
jgi:hypothetical protein